MDTLRLNTRMLSPHLLRAPGSLVHPQLPSRIPLLLAPARRRFEIKPHTQDAADDLSFALFYYTGAASRAGMSYSGAVLGTPDGKWPEQHTARINEALDRAGIKGWELSRVDNSDCVGAPLALA
jgi:hypothetical protein